MINVAVIGAGYWGPNLIRNLASLEGANLVAICDGNPARLKALADLPNVDRMTDVDNLLSRRDIDAVFIAVPAEIHASLTRKCLQAGKHVYVEKPLATHLADASLLCELAERFGLVLMVGHLFLYESATTRLIEEIRKGTIGRLQYAQGLRMSMSGTARLDTNIIWDALIHDAYIQPELFGRNPDRVLAVGGSYLKPDIEDVAFVTFDFGEGALFHCTVSWYALEKVRSLMVIGSKGMFSYNGLSPNPLVRYNRGYIQSNEFDPEGRPYWRWIEGQGEVIHITPIEPLREECLHFLACVASGSRPRTDGWAGLRAVEIVEACAASAKAGGIWQKIVNHGPRKK